MAFKALLKVDNDVFLPAVCGLGVLSLTVIGLYLLRRRRVTAQAGGTRFVTSLDGSQVRRSTRCDISVRPRAPMLQYLVVMSRHDASWLHRSRKSVARWSPDDLASPTGYGTPKTPNFVVEEVPTPCERNVITICACKLHVMVYFSALVMMSSCACTFYSLCLKEGAYMDKRTGAGANSAWQF